MRPVPLFVPLAIVSTLAAVPQIAHASGVLVMQNVPTNLSIGQPATFDGLLKDSHYKLLKNVTVSMSVYVNEEKQPKILTAKTDNRGYFHFEVTPPGFPASAVRNSVMKVKYFLEFKSVIPSNYVSREWTYRFTKK